MEAPAVYSAVLPACWWMVVSPPPDKEPLKSPLNTNQRSQLCMVVDFQNRLWNYFLNSDLLINWETGSISTKGAQEQFGFVCGRRILVQCVHAERAVAGLNAAASVASAAGAVSRAVSVTGQASHLLWLKKSASAPVQKTDPLGQRAAQCENLCWKC